VGQAKIKGAAVRSGPAARDSCLPGRLAASSLSLSLSLALSLLPFLGKNLFYYHGTPWPSHPVEPRTAGCAALHREGRSRISWRKSINDRATRRRSGTVPDVLRATLGSFSVARSFAVPPRHCDPVAG